MNEFDDQPLVREPPPEPAAEVPRPPRRGAAPVLVIAAIGLLLGGAAAWWWARDRPVVGGTHSATAATDELIAPAADVTRALPPLGQMDTFLRALLGTLSSSPELARWLATDDLIRQMAHGIDRMSRGFSPAGEVQVLRPQGDFAVTGGRGEMTINPASYRRYDALASLVASVNAQSVADAYRTIRPRLDEAYRALGRTDSSVDAAVSVALQILIDTPVLRDPVRVVNGKGATYAYADARIEKLLPVQRQLIRLGPENLERVQARLRDIKTAIETTRQP